ncbi:YciI family protein [Maricaulis sp.]|uniref:YciI family protein n=1 Tax=Maricaulis sp. TaxID=1486257 RepID=UPI0025BA44DA|nr:YciI family protein [Maricaulis sp.]
MLFLVHTRDKPDALAIRMANRDAHIAWLKAAGASVKAAGPWLDESGDMAGSLLIIEAEDRAALDVWLAGDPYQAASLFERVEVAPYRWAINPPVEAG